MFTKVLSVLPMTENSKNNAESVQEKIGMIQAQLEKIIIDTESSTTTIEAITRTLQVLTDLKSEIDE
jgi:uncharacterized protein YqgV (UPF0045/DUF77 family)